MGIRNHVQNPLSLSRKQQENQQENERRPVAVELQMKITHYKQFPAIGNCFGIGV